MPERKRWGNCTFMDIDVSPNSLGAWGPSGMAFFRNVQARWTLIQSEKTNLTIALDRKGSTQDFGGFTERIEERNVNARFRIRKSESRTRSFRFPANSVRATTLWPISCTTPWTMSC
jgi:hypothetical protein